MAQTYTLVPNKVPTHILASATHRNETFQQWWLHAWSFHLRTKELPHAFPIVSDGTAMPGRPSSAKPHGSPKTHQQHTHSRLHQMGPITEANNSNQYWQIIHNIRLLTHNKHTIKIPALYQKTKKFVLLQSRTYLTHQTGYWSDCEGGSVHSQGPGPPPVVEISLYAIHTQSHPR